MEQTETTIIELNTAETKKMVVALLKKEYSFFTKERLKISSDSKERTISVLYMDGPSEYEMKKLLKPMSKERNYWKKTQCIFEMDGKKYDSGASISIRRQISGVFAQNCATIVCLEQKKPLPRILQSDILTFYGSRREYRIETEDQFIIDAYNELCLKSESNITQLLQEAQATYGELEKPSDEEEQERERKREEERKRHALRLEKRYQGLLLKWNVYRLLELPEYLETAQKEVDAIEAKIKENDPSLLEKHASLKEQCPAIPVDDRQEEEYQFVLLENGMYEAKNGEYAPILTRDLMHDCRICYWWLWVPNWDVHSRDEVSNALWEAGWRRGYNRKQWFHRNRFAQVPEIVINTYGGYVDGGYCDYRSHRGERLRAYADKVEMQAEQEAEWSDEIVATYMSSGCFVTSYRSSRKMSKLKARAERKAQEAKRLDQWVHELRRRANDSEYHQYRMSSTSMLNGRLDTLDTDRRKFLRDFHTTVDRASDPNYSSRVTPLEDLLEYYEDVERKVAIIDEEKDLINLTLEERQKGREAPQKPVAQEVPSVPTRTNAAESVVEVYVGDNRTDVYPTPSEVGYLLLNHPDLPRIPQDAKLILEPNGGTGMLIDQISLHLNERQINAEIHTYEVLWDLNAHLRTKSNCIVKGYDYLDNEDGAIYDAVVMNPPFSDWLTHVLKALKQLKKGGTAHFILPVNWKNARGKAVPAFVRHVEQYGHSVDLPYGSFAASGTNVAVSLVGIIRPL